MKESEQAAGLRKTFSGPMSTGEVEILQDMQAFIDFAIRNGLSFPMVVASLGHDVNGLARCGFDLAAMRSTGFTPKVTGYRNTTPDDFDESDERSE
jgi:hypothetical protein